MLFHSAESILLVNGKLSIAPPILPKEVEFVHMNTLWCYLFYKLVGDDGTTGKFLSALSINPLKGQTIVALLAKKFPSIPATDNKPTPYITTKTVAYIFALVIDSVTIYHNDSPHSRAL